MRILVTGSNGCVGSALKSMCTDDPNWVFIERKDCDLTGREQTIEFFKNSDADYVVHLASYVPGFYNIDKVSSFSTNVRINENVLEASYRSRIFKGMFCLSVNMFPENPSRFPMDESMIFDGTLSGVFAGYANSKRMLAMQCQNYNEQWGTKYFGLIPCNVYGPNDNLSSGRLIPSLILKFKDAIKNNIDVVISGTGKPLRQFIYSIDLSRIIKQLALNYSDMKPVICCADTEVSIYDLVHQISEIVDFKNNILFDASKPDGNMRKTVSNAYLKSVMPGVSFTPLKTGLEQTIRTMEGL